jgi:hypothetical protein
MKKGKSIRNGAKDSNRLPMPFSQNIGKLPKYWEALSCENLKNVKA